MRATGRLNDLSKLALPAGAIDDPECDEAVAVFRRLVREARGALDAVAAAERELEAARVRDVEALADAKRAGKADPGRKAVERAEDRLDAARRNAEAAALAAERSRDDLAAVVEGRRDLLVERARARAAAARQTCREALVALQEAHADVAGAAAFEAWCASFPDRSKPVVPQRLPGLVSPNGEDYSIAAAVTALAEALADHDRQPVL